MAMQSVVERLKTDEYDEMLESTVVYEGIFSDITSELIADSELCVRVIKYLKAANKKIAILSETFLSYGIDRYLAQNLSNIHWELNKYRLFESDCSWVTLDNDIANAVAKLELCQGILMGKEKYTVKDVVYFAKVLDEISEEFERKIAQFSDIYGI